MTPKHLVAAALAALVSVAGCDQNPGGPSAPSPSPAEPGNAAPAAQPKTQPLKQAGQPIGLAVPSWIAPGAR
jgi:hypothetical protein